MKQCRMDCIHIDACRRFADNSTYWNSGDCPIYKSAADVAPKSEVAREIFEEIERKVASKIPMKFTPIFKRDLGYDAGVIDGKHDAFYEVLVLIAELKKKYTEEKE